MSKRKEDQPETNDGTDEVPEPPAKKGRGRPKAKPPAPPKDSNSPPKRGRGRPAAPKVDAGGDQAEDDDDNDDVVDVAKKSPTKAKKQGKAAVTKSPAKRGRGRPKGSGKAKGRGRPPKAKVEDAEEAVEDAEESS